MGYFRLLRTNHSGLRISEVGALYMKTGLQDTYICSFLFEFYLRKMNEIQKMPRPKIEAFILCCLRLT